MFQNIRTRKGDVGYGALEGMWHSCWRIFTGGALGKSRLKPISRSGACEKMTRYVAEERLAIQPWNGG